MNGRAGWKLNIGTNIYSLSFSLKNAISEETGSYHWRRIKVEEWIFILKNLFIPESEKNQYRGSGNKEYLARLALDSERKTLVLRSPENFK